MLSRALRRKARASQSRARNVERLEDRLAMSAVPMLTHHGFVEDPMIVHHEGAQSFVEPPPLVHHQAPPALSMPVLESEPAFDPHADFWLPQETLSEQEAGERIEQMLNEAHDLTGHDDMLTKYGFDGEGQTVVVIDSGLAYSHAALGGGYGEGYRVVGGWDFTENDADFYDDGPSGSHGTHVGGIIGADGDTHDGVATGVDLVGLRVFDDAGNGYFSWVEQALSWTIDNLDTFDHRITAINLSLGAVSNSFTVPSWSMLEDEFATLEAAGVLIAVSAGNSFTSYNTPGLAYPASSDHVIPVMSVNNNGSMSYFSQRASHAIAAPGRNITSTVPDYAGNDGNTIDDDWGNKSGTSMASPYVAGASVLVREAMQFVGMTDIDQWDIYDHMMATADTFYDSDTDANYKRLNLEAAIDALMPADDYGSTLETAHSLGTLGDTSSPLSAVSGVISTLDDADYFSFTAGVTGQVTFSTPSLTHDLAASWEGWGGSWSVDENGGYAIDVVAGQEYTFALSTADGLGHYDLTYEAQSSFAPVNWGSTPEQETRAGLSVSGEQWYAVSAGRAGYFTVESLPQNGTATVTIHNASQTLLATADGSGRAEVVANAGQSLLLRVTGSSTDFDLRLTNAVSLSGTTVSVWGTSGADSFAVSGGATTEVSVGAVAYEFNAGDVTHVSITARNGDDSLVVDNAAGIGLSLVNVEQVVDHDAAARSLDTDLQLKLNANDYLNWGGMQERWISSSNGQWYFITPNGDFHHWDGGVVALSPVVATLTQDYYDDLTKIVNNTATGLATLLEVTSVDFQYGLTSGGNYYDNWGGLGEKWLSSSGSNWHFITPDGDLYRWNGSSDLVTSPLVASLGSEYFNDPSLLHTAADTDSPDNIAAASLDQAHGFSSGTSYYENWGGRGEKWISDSSNNWHFITPSGGLYRWSGASHLGGSTLLAMLNPHFHNDPTQLTDALTQAAIPDALVATATAEAGSEVAAAAAVTAGQNVAEGRAAEATSRVVRQAAQGVTAGARSEVDEAFATTTERDGAVAGDAYRVADSYSTDERDSQAERRDEGELHDALDDAFGELLDAAA